MTGVIFDEDKSGYLAGVLAGLMSKSGKIGGVFATDVVPAVWRFGEGYRAGIVSVKPDAEINIVYHNDVGFDKTFTDPEWGKTSTISMIDKGGDVIFGAGGKTGNGALIAVAGKILLTNRFTPLVWILISSDRSRSPKSTALLRHEVHHSGCL